VDRLVAGDDALLGRFAAAIDSFPEESGSWWNRLLLIGEQDKQMLDLKKCGIFPIVHGVRSLALSEHVPAAGTQARIDALVAAGRLSPDFATDLADSLFFLIGLKLKAGLAELDAAGAVSGGVRSDRLSSLERDLLKDALAVVKRFKAIVRNQFHLEAT
jgi:CBS domain-containing protein